MGNLKSTSIILPENPFWEVFKRFGRDEVIALVINTIGTIIVAWYLSTSNYSTEYIVMIIALAGPIIEKLGFFPGHFYDAWKEKKYTEKKHKKSQWYYTKQSIRRGTKSLIQDILIHDPLYILLMYIGLSIYPGTPVWMLAILSFVLAVFVVSLIEVGTNECIYKILTKRWLNRKFKLEKYLESRFYIDIDDKSPKELIELFRDEYGLSEPVDFEYSDQYYKTKLPSFNGRTPTMRLRSRTKLDGTRNQTAQITYTKAGEEYKKSLSQYRFFMTKKDKYYAFINGDMPSCSCELIDTNIKKIFDKFVIKKSEKEIHFTRTVAFKEDGLFVSVDYVHTGAHEKCYLIELKTIKNKRLLRSAMKYVMNNFNVVQTTYKKMDIIKE